jgi:signal transduction histidine kinase
MAIATHWADSGPNAVSRNGFARILGVANRNVRLSAALLVILIFACFVAATALQMQRDYSHALAMGASYAEAQAQVLANETARTLDRMAALSSAYVNAVDNTSAAQIIQSGESDRILNIALADADGNFVSSMMGRPLAAERLSEQSLAKALAGRTIEPYSDPAIGSSPMTLVFRADDKVPPRFIVLPLDPRSLLPQNAIGESALFNPNGLILALGDGWDKPPPAYILRSDSQTESTLRHVEYDGVRRIFALSPVPGWPLAAAASVRANDVLGTWYGSVPLYLFVILGPALAGAGIAFVLLREFERTDRARMALTAAKKLSQTVENDTARDNSETADSEAALVLKLSAAEKRADDAERAKQKFTSAMSHELYIPLNAIIGFSEVIQQGHFGPVGHKKYSEYAGDIASAGRNLHAHIEQILEYARLESDKHSFDINDLDIVPMVIDCIGEIENKASERQISLEYEFPEIPLIPADWAAVKRILTNILSNAVRYTPEGGTIRVEARCEEDAIVLNVRESGQGLSPDAATNANEPSTCSDRPDAEKSCSDLGMALAIKLAHRMGGALLVAEDAGEGNWAELRLAMN